MGVRHKDSKAISDYGSPIAQDTHTNEVCCVCECVCVCVCVCVREREESVCVCVRVLPIFVRTRCPHRIVKLRF